MKGVESQRRDCGFSRVRWGPIGVSFDGHLGPGGQFGARSSAVGAD
jgi:hypothetical protein